MHPIEIRNPLVAQSDARPATPAANLETVRLDDERSSSRDLSDKPCPRRGHIPRQDPITGQWYGERCSTLGCAVCGPRRQRFLALHGQACVLDALRAGSRAYRLDLSGGRAGLTLDGASSAWQALRLYLRRHVGLVGYGRFAQIDLDRRGIHLHIVVAILERIGRALRADLDRAVTEAGFGFARYPAMRSWSEVVRRTSYATRNLSEDSKAFAGSGAKLATWSRLWTPPRGLVTGNRP